jgi:hypothetical protein
VPAADGTTNFSVLQNELKGRSSSIVLVGFDLLYLNGDPEAPGEMSSQIGAMTGSHALLAKLKAMESSPERSAGASAIGAFAGRMAPRRFSK